MSAEENKSLVRRYVEEILNRGNMAVADELIASDLRARLRKSYALSQRFTRSVS